MRWPKYTRRRLVWTLLIVVAALILSSLGGTVWFQPRFAVKEVARRNPDVLFKVKTQQKAIALTIDDGPHPEITPGVLDLLAERGAKATFFILGDHIPGQEAVIQRMRDEGHEIGNHLIEDRVSILLPEEEFERQLLAMDPWIDTEAAYRWMRPGSGWFNNTMVEQAEQHGYRVCLGSIFPHDDVIHKPEFLASDVLRRVYPGAIIILHDGEDERATLVEALRLILDGLETEGYRILTVSQLVDLEH